MEIGDFLRTFVIGMSSLIVTRVWFERFRGKNDFPLFLRTSLPTTVLDRSL